MKKTRQQTTDWYASTKKVVCDLALRNHDLQDVTVPCGPDDK